MTSDLRQRRVLVVDDNIADIELVLRALRPLEARYRCLTATSASEGLARCADSAPDIVLLDFYMPDADGFEFLEDLNAMRDPHSVAPIVVMITSQTDPRIAAALIRHGAADYIAKSDVTPERLDAVLYEATRALEQSA